MGGDFEFQFCDCCSPAELAFEVLKARSKPFHGYNPNKHSRKSFCARMSGVKGPTSKKGKLTPKGAALKRWNC